MRPQQTMSAGTWSLLIILSIIWGGSFFFFKILVAELPPLTIVMVRVLIAAGALVAFLYATGQSPPKGAGVWRAFFIMALLNNVIPFTLIVWGEIRISSGLASILNATTPVFSVLLAHFLTKQERLTPNRVVGVVLGLVGAALLLGPDVLRGFNLTSLAQIAVVVSAVMYACAAAYGRRFRAMHVSPVAVASGQLTAAAIVMIPLALAIDRPWTFTHSPSPVAWSALFALALLSTSVAYVLYFSILARAGATNALLVTFLTPVSALLLGALVLKEQLTMLNVAGVLVIFAGLAAIDGRIFGSRTRFRNPATNTGHPN